MIETERSAENTRVFANFLQNGSDREMIKDDGITICILKEDDGYFCGLLHNKIKFIEDEQERAHAAIELTEDFIEEYRKSGKKYSYNKKAKRTTAFYLDNEEISEIFKSILLEAGLHTSDDYIKLKISDVNIDFINVSTQVIGIILGYFVIRINHKESE